MPFEETAPPPVRSVSQRLASWFDLESAALVTILLGLFQVILAVPLAYTGMESMPRIYVLPLIIGILIVTGGSLVMANERNPNRYLLQGCVCSNAVSLLGALIAFCLYCVGINSIHIAEPCDFMSHRSQCAPAYVMTYSMTVLVLLLFYNSGAIILNGVLSALSLKELRRQ